MTADMGKVALYYDDSGYVETLQRPAKAGPGRPVGLMGRQVAGKEFLDAYLHYGSWSELLALVPNQASGRSLLETCRTHPSSRNKKRRLQLFEVKEFSSQFLRNPPASVLFFPCPPDSRFAWARQHSAQLGYALCGVTHTLCSAHSVEALRNLLTAPYEPFDRLICTSRAVIDMVRAVTEAYADYLRKRHGGNPRPRIGLEQIPLGVETNKFRPATTEKRLAERRRLGIGSDEVAVLFVGRLSHHAKAHPFPMFRGLSIAAERTGQKVHLVLSGWASGAKVLEAFRDGADKFAGNLRVSVVDGTSPDNRFAVWRAADIFTSLSDNIQETFGLVIIEAMACGLPVVASDWNGYRDLVVDGQTGFLVPTRMVKDATVDSTLQLLTGEVDYDHFLARTNQCVAVDVTRAAEAYARLLSDSDLRRRMGESGRHRVEQTFAWPRIIKAYENLWAEQEAERKEFIKTLGERPRERRGSNCSITDPLTLPSPTRGRGVCGSYSLGVPKYVPGPVAYPPPEFSFAGYPTQWLEPHQLVSAASDATDRLASLLAAPLTNYKPAGRSSDQKVLQAILDTASKTCTLGDLEPLLCRAGLPRQTACATLAWMLKYDLLRVQGVRSVRK